MTWQDFVDAVIQRITDKKPDEAAFTEAVAEYLRARVALELQGNRDGYAIHQNRYTALRRKLAGFVSTQSEAVLRAGVRALAGDVTPDNNLFALACSYWVKAHAVAEVNRDQEEGGSWMGMYRQKRTQLLGYTHTFADTTALRTAVGSLFMTGDLASTQTTFFNALIDGAVSDLQGLAGWVNQQIAAAKADLEALHERVQKEIRSAVIGLQELAPLYQVGQSTGLTEDLVTPDGYCSRGTLPEQAALREAWIVYPDPDDATASTTCRRRECVRVAWEDRHAIMLCRDCAYPMIAIDPYGKGFLVSPALTDGEVELELIWDGVRLDFADSDETPFDESVAEAVALRVQAALAQEFGDGAAREYRRQADERTTLVYVESLRRQRLAVERLPGRFPRCGGCSSCASSAPSGAALSGYEELEIAAAGASEVSYHPRLKAYHVLARLEAGEGAYTHVIRLMNADRAAGHTVSVLVYLPDSANPTLQIEGEGADAPWVDFTHDGVAGWFRGDFTFDGTGWTLWGWAPVGNPAAG